MGIGKHRSKFRGTDYKQVIDKYSYDAVGEPVYLSAGHKKFIFHIHSSYQAMLYYIYQRPLKVLGYSLYYTTANDTAFNHWTFKDSAEFDEFYYAPTTDILLSTWDEKTFTVNSSIVGFTIVHTKLEQEQHNGIQVGKKILGIAIQFEDKIKNTIKFKKPTENINKYGFLELYYVKDETKQQKETIGSRTQINLHINFNRETAIFNYFGYKDLISELGGMRSAFNIVFKIPIPFFTLVFLISLSGIIQDFQKNQHRNELLRICEEYVAYIPETDHDNYTILNHDILRMKENQDKLPINEQIASLSDFQL